MKKRYIYIGDIHGNKDIISFLNQNDDGNTIFILTGDIFDRGNYSFEIFIKIKELFEKKVLHGVLGNHDLFFIFTHLSNRSQYTYKEQFLRNGGKATIKSFRKNIQYKNNWAHNNIGRGLIEIARWLLSNFNLYYIDDNKNITIHGGIPMFFDGNCVGDFFQDEGFLFGIKYIDKLNRLLKEFDEDTIKKFTTIYNTENILNANNKFYKDKIDGNYKLIEKQKKYFDYFIPTWIRSEIYLFNEKMIEGIIGELNENNLNRLIVGHDFSDFNTCNLKDRIYRIDMGIGILIFDSNKNINIYNLYDILNKKEDK